jgi:hypothetical protein
MLRIALVLLMGSSFAFAQLDSLALRAKLGSPLHRETFHVAAGFDMIVDYSSGGRVCKLEVPVMMPRGSDQKVAVEDVFRKRMQAFLEDVVPLSMRGRQGVTQIRGPYLIFVDYENVSIQERQVGSNPFDEGNTIRIVFKNEPCDR